MKALLAVIAAIGIAKPNAMADTTRIYAGHNATGSAFCAVDSGATTRMYRGHNTTGSASYAIKGQSTAIHTTLPATNYLELHDKNSQKSHRINLDIAK